MVLMRSRSRRRKEKEVASFVCRVDRRKPLSLGEKKKWWRHRQSLTVTDTIGYDNDTIQRRNKDRKR